MEHRSDRYLRQDFIIPVLFDIVARQCINTELQTKEELASLEQSPSENEKEAILTQRMIYEVKDKYKVETLHSGKILEAMIYHELTDYCKRFTLEREVGSRMSKLMKTCVDDVNKMFFSEKIKPDKLILVSLKIVENLNNAGFTFPQYVEDMTNIFLQIEYLHNINEPVENWELLKKSADKQALKYIRKLQEYNYFTTIKAL
jgi:hypothetical protein